MRKFYVTAAIAIGVFGTYLVQKEFKADLANLSPIGQFFGTNIIPYLAGFAAALVATCRGI